MQSFLLTMMLQLAVFLYGLNNAAIANIQPVSALSSPRPRRVLSANKPQAINRLSLVSAAYVQFP